MRQSIKNRRARIIALLVSLAAALGLIAFGFATSGAYFSDTHDGSVTGTLGSIRVSTSGGTGADGLDFTFSNMLPGDPQTATIHYTNTGANAADVWLKFPNATALSALNNLGHYGHAAVVANGVTKFESDNLNDHSGTCPVNPSTDCNPLPSQILVASNVAPGHSGTIDFTFNYTGKLSTQAPAGTTTYWNVYPVSAGLWSPTNTDGQITINAADGTGTGLPYQVVATQHGQQP